MESIGPVVRIVLQTYMWFLIAGGFLCIYRAGMGPTPADRVIAIDLLGITVVGFSAIMSIFSGKVFYINVAIAWALLGFTSSLAFSKHLEGRRFDE